MKIKNKEVFYDRLKNIFHYFIFCIAIYFFYYVLLGHWDELEQKIISPNLFFLIISILLQALDYYWFVNISKKILRLLKFNAGRLPVAKLTILPQIVSYIPGRVLSFVNALYLAEQMKLPVRKFLLLISINQIFLITISLIFGSVVIFFIPTLSEYQFLIPLSFILGCIIIEPKILNWLSGKFFKLFGKEPRFTKLNRFDHFQLFLMFILGLIIEGLAFSFFILSFIPFSETIFFLSIFLFPLARIIGYLSIISPAGFGVREGMIIYVLKDIIGLGTSSFITLAYRIIGMVILLTISIPIYFLKPNKPSS